MRRYYRNSSDLAGSEKQNDWEQRLDNLAAQEGLKTGFLWSNGGSHDSYNVNIKYSSRGVEYVKEGFDKIKNSIRSKLDNSIIDKDVSDWTDDEWTRYKEKNNLD